VVWRVTYWASANPGNSAFTLSAPVSNETGDFPTGLFHVEIINGLSKKVPESARRQRLVALIIARLTHSGFEMTDPNLWMPAQIPYPVIPVTSFHACFPLNRRL
jgi:hypothetical protein